MQLYLVSPILFYLLHYAPKLGYLLATVVYIGGTSLMAYLTIHYELGPESGFIKHITPYEFDEQRNYYEKPWCRFQPYLIGMLLGYVLHKTKNTEIKIPHVIYNLIKNFLLLCYVLLCFLLKLSNLSIQICQNSKMFNFIQISIK